MTSINETSLRDATAAAKDRRPKWRILSELTAMERSYLETALWASHDYGDDGDDVDRGTCLDDRFEIADFTRATLVSLLSDLANFWTEVEWYKLDAIALEFASPAQIGHDFWLTRCGHGAGFWDGDYQDCDRDIGKELTDLSQAYGNVDLYTWRGRVYLY